MFNILRYFFNEFFLKKKNLVIFWAQKIKKDNLFLTIDFYENLQEYFFVQNQFLNMKKKNEKNKNIKYEPFISI